MSHLVFQYLSVEKHHSSPDRNEKCNKLDKISEITQAKRSYQVRLIGRDAK